MNEECLICKAPLAYLEADMLMECEICHKKENSKTRCVNGHYVCNECHTQGLDRIIELCMTSASRDPISIIEQMMVLPTCHARSGASCDGRSGAADRVSQRRRRH